MPRGGANALPLTLHRLRGTYRPGRHGREHGRLPARRVPRPPEGLSEAEATAWRELAPQVAALKTYSAATFTAFRLMVKVIATVDTAPADMPPSAFVRLTQVASGLLGRFGLDPASVDRVPLPPKRRNAMDEILDEYM